MTEYKYLRVKKNCNIYKTLTAGSLPTGTMKIHELLVHPFSTSHSNHVDEVQRLWRFSSCVFHREVEELQI